MSRSGYTDDNGDYKQWRLIMYRGAVKSAFRGARGQAFLKELRDALDAMPVKELIAQSFKVEDGAVCALGAVGARRGLDMTKHNSADDDYDDGEGAASAAHELGIAEAMAREIVWTNDEGSRGYRTEDGKWRDERPDERWARVRMWVWRKILPDDYVRVIR